MVDKHHKNLIYPLIALIDIILLCILYDAKDLATFDRGFCWAVLVVHVYFYTSLIINCKRGVDICHYALALSILLSVFLSHKSLVALALALLLLIQVFWVVFGRCILNEPNDDQTSFLGPRTPFVARGITLILVLKLVTHTLVERGGDVDKKDAEGNTPPHLARRMGKIHQVRALIESHVY